MSAFFSTALILSAIHAESGAELQIRILAQKARLVEQNETRLAALPCADRFEVEFLRACQRQRLEDPSLRGDGEYSRTFCTGAAQVIIHAERVAESDPDACPTYRAEELGTVTGTILVERLKRWSGR